ncbi:hypothetical protein [Bdellovibrio sp. HCB2-146]|uniref:hypothetical protein n=1 Tax=Bdellovibrio sp. HCB2-146 TaxID=3394362 RepID=UPI0039BCA91F
MLRAFLVTAWIGFLSAVAGATVSSVDHPQGVIWRLRESGRVVEAQQFEEQLIKILTTSPVNRVARVNTKTSPSYLVDFGNNIFGFMKEAESKVPRSLHYEYAAYVVDRVLGLNMVPLTVLREVNGKLFSIQLFYPAHSWVGNLPKDHEYNTARIGDIQIFDKIIANKDREVYSGHNAVMGTDGRLVAIDHSRSFQADASIGLWGVKVISSKFKKTLLSISLADFKAALSPVLTIKEIEIFEEKTKATIQQISKLEEKTLPEVAIDRNFEIPTTFKIPIDLREFRFMDFFAVQSALGRNARKQPIESVRQVIQNVGDKEYLYRMAMENWDFYSSEVRDLLLPVIIAHEGQQDQSFLEKLAASEPRYVLEMMKNARLMRMYSYVVFYGPMHASASKITPEIYQGLLQYLVERQHESHVGINYEELFRGPNQELRNRFLRDFYQALIREGLGSGLAVIFRLTHEKNINLPKLLLELTPPSERNEVRQQLLSSLQKTMEAGSFNPDKGSGKLLVDHIKFIQEHSGPAPQCSLIFGI